MKVSVEEETKSFTFYSEPKFQQTSPSWSSALHTAVSFLSRGKIRKACLRGFPLDIPSTKWNIATLTRNFDLAETVTLSNSTKLSENGATRHSQGQLHKNFDLAETITLLKFHKTFGEWSNATFSRATTQKFCFSRDYNVAFYGCSVISSSMYS